MAQQFLKNLECLCVRGVSGTCPGGGHISAKLTASPAALTTSIVSKSSITSVPEKLAAHFDATVEGDGPFYIIKLSKGRFENTGFKHEEALDIAREHGGVIELIRSFLILGECRYLVISLNILDVYDDDSILVKGTGNHLPYTDFDAGTICDIDNKFSYSHSSDDRNWNSDPSFARLSLIHI